jgi:hypothetical protein
VWRGRGVLGCVGDIILRTFTHFIGPDSESTKFLDHPKERKNQKNKQLLQSPFSGYFSNEEIFVNPSMV